MKVDATRYRIVPTRTFWVWWILYSVPALLLYLFKDQFIEAGEAGVCLSVAIQSVLFLAILVITVYGVLTGVQSVRTAVYPPVGSYVLSGWKTAEGPKARMLGVFIALAAGFTFISTLLLIVVLIKLNC
jgi:hypothetical protein